MRKRLVVRILLSAPLTMLGWGVAHAAAAGDAVQQLLTNRLANTLSLNNVTDPTTVAKVRFFVSSDGGKSWTMAQETVLPPGTKELPRFPFKVERDGAYGIMTSVTYRDGRGEPEPRPGQPPQYAVVVDTSAPVINRFDASLIGTSASKAVVRCSWVTADAHPLAEAATLECSIDDGAHFTAVHHGPSEGSADVPLPIAAGIKQVLIRLVVVDQAKNTATSPPRSVAVTTPPTPDATAAVKPAAPASAVSPIAPPTALAPPLVAASTPADPEADLAQAAKGLPTLAEVGAGPPPVLPEIVPVAQDVPLPARPIVPTREVHPQAPVAESVPASQTPPLTPSADQPAGSATKPEAAAKPAATPSSAPTSPAVPRVTPAAPAAAPAQVVDHPAKAPIVAVPESKDGHRETPRAWPFMEPAAAKQLLNDARIASHLGHIDDACDYYERLLASIHARTAAIEEAQLLNREERPKDALTTIAPLPPELMSDGVRIEQGRALISLGRHAAAVTALSLVRGNSPQSREALLLIARCYAAQAKPDEARKLYEFLARGGDGIAGAALAELQRLGR